MRRVRLSPQAREDIEEIAAYFFEQTGYESLSAQFARSVGETTEMLARYPWVGRVVVTSRDANYRRCVVRRFRSYGVFYVVTADEIRIVRVLHGGETFPFFLMTSHRAVLLMPRCSSVPRLGEQTSSGSP